VTCDVATSIGTFDQSDQGSLVRVTPLGISRVTITVYCILHNATVLFPPVAAEPVAASPVAKHTIPFLRTQLSLRAGTKHAGQNPPSSMVRERPTSANVFGIMLGTAI